MKKNLTELKKKSPPELEKLIQTTREEITKLRLGAKVNPQKDTNLLTKKRKVLARMLTVLTEING